MKKSILKKVSLAILIALVITLIASVFAGCKAKGYIDAPGELQAELGVYVVPDYNVVDSDGMILAGYNVTLKSVTKENGEAVDFTPTTVTVEEKGVYKFVYTAGRGVKDAVVAIDFADRTAPKVNFDKNSLPSFYITGNSYRIPQYTLSGDYDRSKCYVKVVHIAEDKTEKEAEIKSNRFTVTEKSGSYAIRIHVEDAVGNANDYEYIKPVDGPEVIKDNVVLYFDEEFGERQVYCYESSYSGRFVSKDDPDAKTYGEEQGAYKVTFNGVETYNNEGYVVMNVPAILDISNCIELEMWVYNDNDTDVRMGATWWNDTVLKAKEWTRVTWSVKNWGKTSENSTSSTVDKVTQYVGVSDISKMALRFIFDYEGKVAPNGTFYLSSMRAVPKVKSVITTDENVSLDKNFYGVGDDVTLTAQEIEGKMFDCFLVDGKPIAGNVFVARETEHTVTAKYSESDLTAGSMTWMTTEQPETVGSDAKVYKIGSDENWVITYDVYGVNKDWCYFGVYVGGNDQLYGVELSDVNKSKLSAYGGSWKCMDGVILPIGYYDTLRAATQDRPMHFIFMRQGDKISAFTEYASELYLIGSVQFDDLDISGNSFGFGERTGKNLTNATLTNIKIVAGEMKTRLFAETLVSKIKTTNVTTDKQSYVLGDTVTLTADKAPEGKILAYYEVDGVRIKGNTFVVTSSKHTVEAVYLLPEQTYEVKVDEYDEYVKLSDGSLTLPNAKVVDLDGNVKDYDITVNVTDRSGKQYPVLDGKIAIDYVGSLRLTITYSVKELDNREATIYVVVQSGETLYAPEKDNADLIGRDNVVFNTTKKHGDDKGSLKFTPQIVDDYFTLDYFDFRGYDFVEFYVYTNDDGVWAGSWWLGDTPLVKGEWTKVVIDLKGNVYLKYEDGSEFVPNNNKDKPYAGKFIVRIQHAENKDVWISSVKAGLWPSATIETDDNVTLDKESYKLRDTVVLTAKPAPEGKIFSHFTVDGVKIDGNQFVITKTAHTVAAVYNDSSTLELVKGVTTAENKTTYARGETVTLVFNGTAPDKQFFNHFIVDGKLLNGNSFVASAAKHTVEVAFASTVDQMTWTTAEFVQPEGDDAQKTKLGEGTNWVLKYDIYGLIGDCYFGAYVGGADQLYGYELAAVNKLSGYGGVWKEMDGVKIPDNIYDIIRSATEQKPLSAIYARNGETITAYIKYDGIIHLVGSAQYSAFGITGNSFGLGGRANRADGTISNIKFVVGEAKTQAYLNSLTTTINKTNVTTDKDVYTLGETVTLTAAPAEAGFKFSYFTVNGDRIEGNTFVIATQNVEIAVVYEDERQIDVADMPVNGSIVKITNDEYTLPTAKIVDAAGTELSNLALTLTVTDAAGNVYKDDGGKITISYKGVIDLTVTYASEELDKEVSFTITLQRSDSNVIMQASETGVKVIDPNGNKLAYDPTVKHGDDEGSVKVFDIVSGETGVFLSTWDLTDYKFIEFYAYTEDEGVQMGGWWCNDTPLVKNQWTKVIIDKTSLNSGRPAYDYHDNKIVLRIMGSSQGKTVWISTVKAYGVNDFTQINDISNSKVTEAGSTCEWTTEKIYNGDDKNVVDQGSLKVTTKEGENYIISDTYYIKNLSDYSEVYFYVYTDSTNAKAQAGAWWCGDTDLQAGQWTKITLTEAMNPLNVDNKGIFTNGVYSFVFRLKDVNAGEVFYVTSLYGVPKA